MIEIRKKQKKLYKLMRMLVIITAVFLFVYIGAKPYVMEFNTTLAAILNYASDGLVIVALAITFIYYSKYGKIDYILTCAEDEINDNGCFLTSRKSTDFANYEKEVFDDLKNHNFNIVQNVEGNDFNFNFRAFKGKQYFYLASIEALDGNDVLAYLDETINDLTVKNLKRKGTCVLTFITDNADESALALSKMITPIGRKNQLKIALAIVELSSGRVYFNGYRDTKAKALIANFVMNCEVPIKGKYIIEDKLKCQLELEEKLSELTLKEIKSDNFYIH